MARPTKFTQEIANTICNRIGEGESLRAICRDPEMDVSIGTVLRWVSEDEAFREQYARAMEARADAVFEELLDIADDGQNDWMEKELQNGNIIEVPNHEHITRSRLRVDARRWMLGKMQPKKYGDFSRQEITGKDGAALNAASVSDAQIAAALTALAHNTPPVHTDPLADNEVDENDASDLV